MNVLRADRRADVANFSEHAHVYSVQRDVCCMRAQSMDVVLRRYRHTIVGRCS